MIRLLLGTMFLVTTILLSLYCVVLLADKSGEIFQKGFTLVHNGRCKNIVSELLVLGLMSVVM